MAIVELQSNAKPRHYRGDSVEADGLPAGDYGIGSTITYLDGSKYEYDGNSWNQTEVAGAPMVFGPGQTPGLLVIEEITDPVSGTKTTITLPAPAKRVSIRYSDEGSAVGKKLFVAFGAVDDTDADAMLGTASSVRRVVSIDRAEPDVWAWSAGGPMRIDIISDVASETGATFAYVEVSV